MRAIAAVLAALVPLAALCPLPGVAAERVALTADKMVINDAAHEAVFTGNVQVTHPDVTVRAPMVVVTYGEGGTTDIESFIASGGVSLKTSDQSATGDIAVFDPATEILRLSGNVVVVNEGGTLKGPELLVNLADNTSVFSGGPSGRVTAVFTPQ